MQRRPIFRSDETALRIISKSLFEMIIRNKGILQYKQKLIYLTKTVCTHIY